MRHHHECGQGRRVHNCHCQGCRPTERWTHLHGHSGCRHHHHRHQVWPHTNAIVRWFRIVKSVPPPPPPTSPPLPPQPPPPCRRVFEYLFTLLVIILLSAELYPNFVCVCVCASRVVFIESFRGPRIYSTIILPSTSASIVFNLFLYFFYHLLIDERRRCRRMRRVLASSRSNAHDHPISYRRVNVPRHHQHPHRHQHHHPHRAPTSSIRMSLHANQSIHLLVHLPRPVSHYISFSSYPSSPVLNVLSILPPVRNYARVQSSLQAKKREREGGRKGERERERAKK